MPNIDRLTYMKGGADCHNACIALLPWWIYNTLHTVTKWFLYLPKSGSSNTRWRHRFKPSCDNWSNHRVLFQLQPLLTREESGPQLFFHDEEAQPVSGRASWKSLHDDPISRSHPPRSVYSWPRAVFEDHIVLHGLPRQVLCSILAWCRRIWSLLLNLLHAKFNI